MARYRDAVCRICRRMGKAVPQGGSLFHPEVRGGASAHPTGPAFGPAATCSDRGMQLREKQKARQAYGLLERQFQRMYREAVRRPGATGANLLQMLELRLDNIVYRMGLADPGPRRGKLFCMAT